MAFVLDLKLAIIVVKYPTWMTSPDPTQRKIQKPNPDFPIALNSLIVSSLHCVPQNSGRKMPGGK